MSEQELVSEIEEVEVAAAEATEESAAIEQQAEEATEAVEVAEAAAEAAEEVERSGRIQVQAAPSDGRLVCGSHLLWLREQGEDRYRDPYPEPGS